MKRPVIFFDLAGVLLRWDTDAVYRDIFGEDHIRRAHFFKHVLSDSRLREIATGRGTQEVIADLQSQFPEYHAALSAWWSRWDEMVSDPFPETVALSRRLRARGYETNILGNWSRDEFERARKRFDFLDEFHEAIISGDVGVMKPDPRIFETALERRGVNARESIFIDDTEKNVAAAAALGMRGIHFQDARQLTADLQSLLD